MIKRFANIYEFCNEGINNFNLLLRKGVYPNEYMDSWEKYDETLSDKEAFYSSLNMEHIIDVDHRHANRVFKAFKLKGLGQYHDLYVNANTIQLSDIYENFRNMCIKVYELDPAHFLSTPGLARQVCLKKTKRELKLITDFNILLMVEQAISGGICHVLHRYFEVVGQCLNYYQLMVLIG